VTSVALTLSSVTMKRALVLAGGGVVGMGYHAGALAALEEAGLDPCSSDVIVGTSAGAIIAAYLSSGWSPQRLFEDALNQSPPSGADAYTTEMEDLFAPLWRNPGERFRRLAGGAFVTLAALGYWERVAGARMPGPRLRAAFPSALYSSRATKRRLRSDLPKKWPRPGLFLCAVELYSGRRVVFGSEEAPPAQFSDAVLASAAVPGIFDPIKIGDRLYVDGGMKSATSLDVAVKEGCERVVCIAPLGWEREEGLSPYAAPFAKSVLLRSLHTRAIQREATAARAAGVDVTLLRPWLSELPDHGMNSLRWHNRGRVAQSAHRNTLRTLARSGAS
jgi:NTE family protein